MLRATMSAWTATSRVSFARKATSSLIAMAPAKRSSTPVLVATTSTASLLPIGRLQNRRFIISAPGAPRTTRARASRLALIFRSLSTALSMLMANRTRWSSR